jgi:hypothetical protein
MNENEFVIALNVEQSKRDIALKVRSTISEIAKINELQIIPNMELKSLYESGWFRNWDDLDFRFRIERKLGVRIKDLHVELGKLRIDNFASMGDLIIYITNTIFCIINGFSENQLRHAAEPN